MPRVQQEREERANRALLRILLQILLLEFVDKINKLKYEVIHTKDIEIKPEVSIKPEGAMKVLRVNVSLFVLTIKA